MQPSQVREVTLGLSDTLLTVFCLVDDGSTGKDGIRVCACVCVYVCKYIPYFETFVLYLHYIQDPTVEVIWISKDASRRFSTFSQNLIRLSNFMFIFHTKYHQNQHFHPLTEFYNYLSFDIGLSSVNSHHRFGETVAIIPGTTHHLPDLFLTPDGVAMLMDEVWKFTVLNCGRGTIVSLHTAQDSIQ